MLKRKNTVANEVYLFILTKLKILLTTLLKTVHSYKFPKQLVQVIFQKIIIINSRRFHYTMKLNK